MVKSDQDMTLSSQFLCMRHTLTTNLMGSKTRLIQTTNITMTAHTKPILWIERMDSTPRRSHSMLPSRQKRKLKQTIKTRQISLTICSCNTWSQSKQLQRRQILQIATKSNKKRHNSTNLNNLTTKTLKSHKVESMSFNRNHNQLLKHKVQKREEGSIKSRLNLQKILKKRRKRKLVTLSQIRTKTVILILDHEIRTFPKWKHTILSEIRLNFLLKWPSNCLRVSLISSNFRCPSNSILWAIISKSLKNTVR